MSYYFNKVLKSKNFEESIELVTAELKKEGFGVLTEINVKDTLKNKIDVDFKKKGDFQNDLPLAAFFQSYF